MEKERPVFAELIKFSLNKQKWDKRYGFFSRFFRRRAQTFNYNVLQPCRRNSWYRTSLLRDMSFDFTLIPIQNSLKLL